MKLSGSRLGPYEIQSAIGAGGMGEVYRARDTRLDRMVAVKVIAATAASDPSFRERFDREARAISSLDHPHICTLYDVGHENGVDFLVMQLLEGQTLADRLSQGRPASDPSSATGSGAASTSTTKAPITIEQALRYGAEIADALNAAHKRGIVHRDLKPGNIIITKSGTKLLDFGLAKLAEQPALAGMEGATHTLPLTGSGSIVGTLNYMSPEQLEGGAIDTRTDIFSFGAVLFEMLTGRRAFNAQSHAGLIAAILNDQRPSLDATALKTSLPVAAHRALDRLIRRCLAKDPDDRWQSAADLGAELRWIDEEQQRWSGQPEAAGVPPLVHDSRRRARGWRAAAVAALLMAALALTWSLRRSGAPPEPVTFTVHNETIAQGPGFLAVSPDGRQIALATGTRDADGKLAVRTLGSTDLRILPGTDGAWQPFWSPDGRAIAFIDRRGTGGSLKRVDVSGGPTTTLVENVSTRGAWSSAGVILINERNHLVSVSERGGPTTQVTTIDNTAGETSHVWPQFLPDGRRFLYLATYTDRSKNAIYVGSLDSAQRTRLVTADSSFELSGGHLLYQHDGKLFAHPFDAKEARTTGDPHPIVEGVAFNSVNGRASMSASVSGDVLAYRLGSNMAGRNALAWFDLKGKRLTSIGDREVIMRAPAVSPDGTRVAVGRLGSDSRSDIYVIDSERNVSSRLTYDPLDDTNPVWSHDSAWVYFTSPRKGPLNIYRRSASGGVADEPVLESDDQKWPNDISRDGKVLLFTRGANRRTRDIWALPLTGERKPFPVVSSTFNEEGARFSPDGKWIVYTSDDLQARNVYAEPFPPTGARIRLSSEAGSGGFWSADGRTVYYLSSDEKLMAVDVPTVNGTLQPATARELFQLPTLTVNARVTPDWRNQRLLAPIVQQNDAVEPVYVVLHWARALLK